MYVHATWRLSSTNARFNCWPGSSATRGAWGWTRCHVQRDSMLILFDLCYIKHGCIRSLFTLKIKKSIQQSQCNAWNWVPSKKFKCPKPSPKTREVHHSCSAHSRMSFTKRRTTPTFTPCLMKNPGSLSSWCPCFDVRSRSQRRLHGFLQLIRSCWTAKGLQSGSRPLLR